MKYSVSANREMHGVGYKIETKRVQCVSNFPHPRVSCECVHRSQTITHSQYQVTLWFPVSGSWAWVCLPSSEEYCSEHSGFHRPVE